MHCLRRGANYGAPQRNDDDLIKGDPKEPSNAFEKFFSDLIEGKDYFEKSLKDSHCIFLSPKKNGEQELIDAILDALIYDRYDRDKLRCDPLVRLLISNPEEDNYEFTIVTAMGVITDGKRGNELKSTLSRLQEQRGVKFIRADTVRTFKIKFFLTSNLCNLRLR
jgi:hypothetical protein